MADQIVSVIAAGGGDYTSVQAAIDDADFAGIDRYIVEIQDASTYTENVTIGGSANGPPTASSHVVLRVNDANYHAGVVGAGAKIRGNTGGHSVTISEAFVHLLKLNVLIDTTASVSAECVRLTADDLADDSLIERCILDADTRNEGVTDQVDCVHSTGDVVDITHTFYNSLFIDAGRSGIHDFQSDCTFNVEFCTVFGCGLTGSFGAGIFLGRGNGAGSTTNIYNTASVNESVNADGDFDQEGSSSWVGSNNLSGDASAPGTSPTINEAAADLFTAPATFDLSIKDVDSALYLGGTDRSGSKPDSRVDATVDIKGNTRPTTPSIGAYEFVSGDRTITAAQAGYLATQAATAKAIVKVTSAASAYLATQSSTVAVRNKVTAAQSAYLGTQSATLTTGLSTRLVSAAQVAFLAQQSSTAKLISKITAAQSAYLATQTAELGELPTSVVSASQAAYLATQAATVTVADAPAKFLSTEVAFERVRPAVFFDLDLAAGATNVWTGTGEIEVDGTVYLPIDAFEASFSISESIDLEDLSVDLRLVGAQAEFLAIALNEPVQGRLASVWLGAMDTRGRLVVRRKIFMGVIRAMPLRQSGDGQQITIEVESSLTFRNNGPVLRYASGDQSLIDPSDTFFDSLPGQGSQEIRFGR